jgi:hypothetical protein
MASCRRGIYFKVLEEEGEVEAGNKSVYFLQFT